MRAPSARALSLLLPVLVASACATGGARPVGVGGDPEFPSYQPIHPITVWLAPGSARTTTGALQQALLEDLANSSSLFAMTRLSGSVGGAYGPASATVEGASYRATYDYVLYHTLSTTVQLFSAGEAEERAFSAVAAGDAGAAEPEACWRRVYEGPMPVYIGLGVRVQVDFTTAESNVSVGSLSTLGAEAEVERLSGSLSVQTLGVTSKQISALMPVESELSAPAVQRVVEAIGAIKANVYSDDNVAVPQIVGFQSPVGDAKAIAALTRFVYGLDYEITTRSAPDREGVGIVWDDLVSEASEVPRRLPDCPVPPPAASGAGDTEA